MVERLNTHQAIVKRWQEHAYGEEPTIDDRIQKLREEFSEVIDAAGTYIEDGENNPHFRKEIAKEAADLIIASLGLISVLGHDFDSLFYEKLDTIYRKYNPAIIAAYRAQGMELEDAIEATKQLFNHDGPGGNGLSAHNNGA